MTEETPTQPEHDEAVGTLMIMFPPRDATPTAEAEPTVTVYGATILRYLDALEHGFGSNPDSEATLHFEKLIRALLDADQTTYTELVNTDVAGSRWVWATGLQPYGLDDLDHMFDEVGDHGFAHITLDDELLTEPRDIYTDTVPFAETVRAVRIDAGA